MKKSLIWILIFIFLFSYYPAIGETTYQITVVDLQRVVKRDTSNSLFRLFGFSSWEETTTGDILKPGDRIKTGEDSYLELRYDNGTFTRIGEKSLIEIGENKKNEQGYRSTLKVKQGRIWARVKKAWKKITNFRVVTPSAVAGVKGTLFSVAVEKDTILSVKEGLVQFSNKNNNEKVLVGKGMMSQVSRKGEITEPHKMNREEKNSWQEKNIESWIKTSEKTKEVPGKALGHDKDKDLPENAKDKKEKEENQNKGKGNNGKDNNSREENNGRQDDNRGNNGQGNDNRGQGNDEENENENDNGRSNDEENENENDNGRSNDEEDENKNDNGRDNDQKENENKNDNGKGKE